MGIEREKHGGSEPDDLYLFIHWQLVWMRSKKAAGQNNQRCTFCVPLSDLAFAADCFIKKSQDRPSFFFHFTRFLQSQTLTTVPIFIGLNIRILNQFQDLALSYPYY